MNGDNATHRAPHVMGSNLTVRYPVCVTKHSFWGTWTWGSLQIQTVKAWLCKWRAPPRKKKKIRTSKTSQNLLHKYIDSQEKQMVERKSPAVCKRQLMLCRSVNITKLERISASTHRYMQINLAFAFNPIFLECTSWCLHKGRRQKAGCVFQERRRGFLRVQVLLVRVRFCEKKKAENICGGNTKHILDYFYSTFTISIRKLLLITSLNDIGTEDAKPLTKTNLFGPTKIVLAAGKSLLCKLYFSSIYCVVAR